MLMPNRLFKARKQFGFAPITEGWEPAKKGIAFVTYTGNRRGPVETLTALGAIEMRMEDMRIKCIGKFACPGKIFSHFAVDKVADAKKWTVEQASDTIQRFRDDPNHAEFASLSAEDRKLLQEAVADKRDVPGWDRSIMWHWEQQKRPQKRDLLKAEIFLEEILEDYYEGGIEAFPHSQYICIA